ncbi:hypothetical protein CBR_g12855 [Chara braunii]|uniref:Uncharacterized protein n=1 Tax=Chara braunii TaxID=69332 RepID=A0A388KT16_CHABU|nr:hypothetical protein CBR_g12855 [Chara braunii]|eukprot:GBG73138.1 hypothetical protein CBR_g12855 [Chara braunii]
MSRLEQEHGSMMLLDFRNAFRGSILEKYHVVPLQLASLDTTTQRIDLHRFVTFLLWPGNASLLKSDQDAFIHRFVSAFPGLGDVSCYCAAAEMARELQVGVDESVEGIASMREDATGQRDRLPALAVQMIQLALSRPENAMSARMFQRSGRDVTHETDANLVQKMCDFCKLKYRKLCRHLEVDYPGWWYHCLTHLIDFDLVGIDGKHFPLRMVVWDPYLFSFEHGWFAEVRDRETGVLIAKADGDNRRYNGETLLKVVPKTGVGERYKPHGNVPTAQKTSGIFMHVVEDFLFYSIDNNCSMFSSKMDSQEVASLHDLREASFRRFREPCQHITFSGRSEFERLIPVAASLSYLHFDYGSAERVYRDFDSVVCHFGLRKSLLEDVLRGDLEQCQANCKRFQSIFKETCWEQLPEDLVMRILDLVVHPPRHIVSEPFKPQPGRTFGPDSDGNGCN